jgi:hypothetical protein
MRCTVNIYAYINHLALNKVNHLAIINKPTKHRKAMSRPGRTSTCSGQHWPLFHAFRGKRALWGSRLFLVHVGFPNLTTRDKSCNSQMFEGFSLWAWNKRYMTRAGCYLDRLVQPIHQSTPGLVALLRPISVNATNEWPPTRSQATRVKMFFCFSTKAIILTTLDWHKKDSQTLFSSGLVAQACYPALGGGSWQVWAFEFPMTRPLD